MSLADTTPSTSSSPSPDPYVELLSAEDPYPMIHQLRRERPVHRTSLGFWFVTRHDDVKRLFHDPENVTGDRRAWEHFQPVPDDSPFKWAETNSLFALPPADHARIRRLVSAAFTPRAVARMEGQIDEVVARVAEPLRGRTGETVDLLGDFTNRIPNAVICRITGIPPGDDEERFREIAQCVISGFLPFSPPDQVKKAGESFTELSQWVRSMCAVRREAPQEDLLSDLLRAQADDEQLTEDDIVMLLTGILAAGSETTALGGMALIATLLQHPGALARLRDDRSLLPNAVNEVVRFAFGGPAGIPRYALRDFTLRGQEIGKGQMLMLSFGGANRDPAIYDDPDTLDIDRDVKDLLAFGNGPHFCLGANLARKEMGAMLDALLDVVPPGSSVDEDAMDFQDAGMFKRPLNLPVRLASA